MAGMPDYMIAKPTEARPKFSLSGTTLDPTPQDTNWINSELRKPDKSKSELHNCYEDPFLRMTAYRLEDTVKNYHNVDKDIRSKEEKALYFNTQPPADIKRLEGSNTNRNLLPLNYNRSEMNDQYHQYQKLTQSDIYQMNRVGLKPVPADRLPTGNYNYDKYRPRQATQSFEQMGQIVSKPLLKGERENDPSQAAQKYPNLRSSQMRQVVNYDHKKAMSRREYPTLSDKTAAELPANIKHKFGLRAAGSETAGIVDEEEIKDLFQRYDQRQLQMMERHLAAKKSRGRRPQVGAKNTVEEIAMLTRSNLFGGPNERITTENKDNYTIEEYDRSRTQYVPPDGARRYKDEYSKWVGLNVLDQKHQQEWREYLQEKPQH